ncbi:carbohydrate ABC transporter permease [Agrococcus jenensis]|uniref:Carbohydrate ABC transporter membrane protein 1 (CUT1 family) n=1 Tax=Agrococcus jenensis TaxID=46353 RepID=A0A3N2AUW6_9MICO|nr:sugar ABC transporter permease [Agrococcus jenensis]ROR66760.1 carbohydrate ABC transporter membrane protein 1 (CUT1 family) [Agrococcus jenensis]
MSAVDVVVAERRLTRRSRFGPERGAWLLFLPAMLPILVFSVWPLLQGIALGFTNATAARNATVEFTGVENYVELAGYELFWNSFGIGLIWAFSVTIIQFFASLSLALLLNANLWGQGIARTLALIPWAMPPVIIAIMWRLMLHPTYGAVNGGLGAVGLPDSINWLGQASTALPAAIVVGVWAGMPQTTITLLAGLQGVNAELHEAAQIDGAGTWQRFFSVTLPALRPVIIAITTLDFINNFNSFALVYVLTAGAWGTMLPMLFAYNEAFRYGNFGLASAMGNVIVIVIAIFLFFYLRSQARGREA